MGRWDFVEIAFHQYCLLLKEGSKNTQDKSIGRCIMPRKCKCGQQKVCKYKKIDVRRDNCLRTM